MATLTVDEFAGQILTQLREDLGEPSLAYAEFPHAVKEGPALVCALRLANAPPEMAGPLIARATLRRSRMAALQRQQAVHSALRDSGYPAPRIVFASTGGGESSTKPFMLMERIEGRLLFGPNAGPRDILRLPARVVRHQRVLHNLDVEAFSRAVTAHGGDVERITVAAQISRLADRIEKGHAAWLSPGLEWLRRNAPPEPRPTVVCHGDFHGGNIIMRGGELAGVIDWQNATIGDPASDVANAAQSIFRRDALAPVLRPFVGPLRTWARRRYVQLYRRYRDVRTEDLRYYNALRAYSMITARRRWVGKLAAGFERHSGVRLQQP